MSGSLRLCLCKSRIGILEVETLSNEWSESKSAICAIHTSIQLSGVHVEKSFLRSDGYLM